MNKQNESETIGFYSGNAVAPVFLTNKEKLSAWKLSNEQELFFVAKDNFWTKDFPTAASSDFLSTFRTYENATVIDLLEKAGYQLLGKSALDEFACGGTGLFSARGPLFNPHDRNRLVGGSSSGSALAVAEKIVPFALAHDTGDSVRRPAAYCGLVGWKPSYGVVSRYGVIPMASSLDTVGVIARDLVVTRKIFQIIAQVDHKDLVTLGAQKVNAKMLAAGKIAVIKGIEQFLSKEYATLYLKTLDLLANDYQISEVEIPEFIREKLQVSYLALCSSELVSHLGALKGVTYGNSASTGGITAARTSSIGKFVKERILVGSYFLKNEQLLLNARKVRELTKIWTTEVFNNFGFLVFPVSVGIAPLVGASEHMTSFNTSHWSDNLLLLANFTGNPSINIPIGTEQGMPLSINIDSSWKNDQAVLELAADILARLRK